MFDEPFASRFFCHASVTLLSALLLFLRKSKINEFLGWLDSIGFLYCLVVGPPLWKIWVRQLGWLFPILMGTCQKWQPNHQPAISTSATSARAQRLVAVFFHDPPDVLLEAVGGEHLWGRLSCGRLSQAGFCGWKCTQTPPKKYVYSKMVKDEIHLGQQLLQIVMIFGVRVQKSGC